MKRIVCLLAVFLGVAACSKEAPAPAAAPTGSAAAPAPAANAGTDPFAVPEKSAAQKEAEKQKNALKRPFLWKLEKDGKTSYALGTVHVGVDPYERLPQLVWDLVDKSPTFAMETNVDDPRLAKMMSCDKCSLKKTLGPAYWKKFEDAMGADVAAKLDGQPIAVATMQLSLKDMKMTFPMDAAVHARAKTRGKKIVFLEDAMTQGDLLTKWMTAKALKLVLDDLPHGKEQTDEMYAAYIAGDDPALRANWDAEQKRMLEHGFTKAEVDDQANDMLFKRNASWIAPIEKMHAEGGGFIAVGALHLVGPQNVLEMLTQRGFTVSRMTPGSGPN